MGEGLAVQTLWINCGWLKLTEAKWASLLTCTIYTAFRRTFCLPSLLTQNNLWIISPVNAFNIQILALKGQFTTVLILCSVPRCADCDWQGSQNKLELNPNCPAYGMMFIYISNWYFSHSCGPVHNLLIAIQIINWEMLFIWLYIE